MSSKKNDKDVSNRVGPLVRIEDLNESQLALIIGETYRLTKIENDPWEIYIKVITRYGIMCPHPHEKRIHDYDIKFRWFECELCGCSVISTNHESQESKNTDEDHKKRVH